jgi:hypothetical protein
MICGFFGLKEKGEREKENGNTGHFAPGEGSCEKPDSRITGESMGSTPADGRKKPWEVGFFGENQPQGPAFGDMEVQATCK